jgi:hypothetical protein
MIPRRASAGTDVPVRGKKLPPYKPAHVDIASGDAVGKIGRLVRDKFAVL